MQQLSQECLGWGLEVQAFSWGIVVGGDDGIEDFGTDGGEIGFAWQGPAHASDCVLDPALLPGAVGIAEEGLDTEVGFEAVVLGELGAVVESDGLAQLGWQRFEPGDELSRGGFGSFVWLSGEDEDTGHALVGDQDGLAIGFEEHEVGFPMSWEGPAVGGLGALGDGDTALDGARGRTAFAAAPAAFGFGPGKIVPPGAVVGAADLGIDEAIDAFMADAGCSLVAGQPAGDLFGRPAVPQPIEHEAAQLAVALQARSGPAPGFRLLMSIARLVADLLAPVAPQLARNRRWRAIQSCRDLADGLPVFMKTGNPAPFIQ